MRTRARYSAIEVIDRLGHLFVAGARTCVGVLEYLTRVESDPHREARQRLERSA